MEGDPCAAAQRIVLTIPIPSGEYRLRDQEQRWHRLLVHEVNGALFPDQYCAAGGILSEVEGDLRGFRW